MPKMKTHRGAAKRFKLTGTGKIKKNKKAFRSHFLEKKSPQRKRKLRQAEIISPADEKRVRRMLGK
jgi:large subunit ribosomal protein L35